MTHVTCRLTAKNRDQLRNPTLGNRVWATFTFLDAQTRRQKHTGRQTRSSRYSAPVLRRSLTDLPSTTATPRVLLGADMAATCVHSCVSGSYRSTELRYDHPSWPPTAYRAPPSTAAPDTIVSRPSSIDPYDSSITANTLKINIHKYTYMLQRGQSQKKKPQTHGRIILPNLNQFVKLFHWKILQ